MVLLVDPELSRRSFSMELVPIAPVQDGERSLCTCVGSFKCVPCKTKLIREYETSRKRAYRERLKSTNSPAKKVRLSITRQKMITSKVIQCFEQYTQGLDSKAKAEIVTSILNHQALRDVQFNCASLHSHKVDEPTQDQKLLLHGLQNTLMAVKTPKSSRELFVKRASIMMVMNSASKKPNIAAASRLLGVH